MHPKPIEMNFNSRRLLFFAIMVLTASSMLYAQKKSNHYLDYIEKYSQMAIEQQQTHGIPASITLAQGLLESAAGRSYLATKGNNHFGIKCHKEWTGDTLLRNDDEANECFRAYDTAMQSFEDHSRFLKRKRYAPCFELDPTDYASWARTLRQCGYATDPNYADRLITIIELYALYSYDSDNNTETAEATAEFIRSTLAGSHVVRRSRNLHFVIATPGDTYVSLAKEFNLDARRLAALNDADNPETQIKEWEEVYLQEKHADAPTELSHITIGEDESIHSIAQRLGMKQSSLLRLNPKAKDQPGTKLKLR